MEGTVANLEKYPKSPLQQLELAESSDIPTRARSPRLVGRYIKNRQSDTRGSAFGHSPATGGVILRLEDVAATPGNVERIRERIRQLNRQLAASGAPLRLRMI
jgi:hypothetical protein